MIATSPLRAATLCSAVMLTFGCASPRPIPRADLVRAGATPASDRFEITVSHGEVLPTSAADGGVMHVPLYHLATSLALPRPWINGSSSPVHVFMITGAELAAEWTLAARAAPLRMVTREALFQPILGQDLLLRVSVSPDEAGIRLVAVDAAGAELGPGFALTHGGYLWIGGRDWNAGAEGTLVTIRPATR